MRKRHLGTTAPLLALLVTLACGSALAAGGEPMTPELAAKREMVRKQEEQRVTPEKKKAAAEALKAERLKVYQAREAAKKLDPARQEKAE